jgi:NAD(P)-dependent dehydrogenase (short-subunit alcohol dehydrogenase family)
MKRPRVVVVTGASAGVGRATVRAFAKAGADVALLARNEAALEEVRAEVIACGRRAVVCPLDVSDAKAVTAAAARIEAQLGPIDVWVNNAMVSVFSPVDELEPDEVRRVTEVTYLGAVYGTLAALRSMLPRDRGTIVQVGSALAYRGIPLQAAYCGAKHALQGFNESLRCELLHRGSNVKVTMVQLPALDTPQFEVVRTRLPRHPKPVPPIYEPELAAEAIVWASRHPRREHYVAGSTAIVIAGNQLLPGLGDHYLARTGFDAQQTDEPVDPNRPDNLWEPLPGDRGAHGRFGADAKPKSLQWSAATHRGTVAAAAGGLALVLRRLVRRN